MVELAQGFEAEVVARDGDAEDAADEQGGAGLGVCTLTGGCELSPRCCRQSRITAVTSGEVSMGRQVSESEVEEVSQVSGGLGPGEVWCWPCGDDGR